MHAFKTVWFVYCVLFTGCEAILSLGVIGAFIRVEGQKFFLPKLRYPQSAAAAQTKGSRFGQIGAVNVAGVDKGGNLIDLEINSRVYMSYHSFIQKRRAYFGMHQSS